MPTERPEGKISTPVEWPESGKMSAVVTKVHLQFGLRFIAAGVRQAGEPRQGGRIPVVAFLSDPAQPGRAAFRFLTQRPNVGNHLINFGQQFSRCF